MKTRQPSGTLLIVGLLLAVVSFVLPAVLSAAPAGCDTARTCTYNGWIKDYPGHCGYHDTTCYCFADEGSSHQPEAACNAQDEE